MEYAAFGRFVALDEHDAPALLQRMPNCDLPVDGSRYGVSTRLIARRDAQVSDLAVAVMKKLFATTSLPDRIADTQSSMPGRAKCPMINS